MEFLIFGTLALVVLWQINREITRMQKSLKDHRDVMDRMQNLLQNISHSLELSENIKQLKEQEERMSKGTK